jgi:hypothetical protein
VIALALTALAAAGVAQAAPAAQDLEAALAEKLAVRFAPAEQVSVNVLGGSADENARRREIRDAIVGALRSRGVAVSDRPDAATRVDITCGDNIRERNCVAEIRKRGAWDVVTASRVHSVGAGEGPMPLSLDWRPLFAQRDPILDVAPAGDRLFVLAPTAVVGYERRADGWQRVQTRAVAQTRTWPRDVRGRLWIEGTTLEVRLPGVACRGAVDVGSLTCVDERQPWPIGIENAGLDGTRNYFTTPQGLPFFAAAPAGVGVRARWVLADQFGHLAWFEGGQIVPTGDRGDDVVALTAPCAEGANVLVSSPSLRRRDADMLRLLRVVGSDLLPVAAPVDVAGMVTALWAAPGATNAVAVVRDAGGERYEAIHVAIACDR